MPHDIEAYEKAKAIVDKFWPADMCEVKETFARSHIQQAMALEFERIRTENGKLRAAFRANMLRYGPREGLDAEIDRVLRECAAQR